MCRIRFVALGIVSFVVSIFGALLAPGTFLNRALSAALCTVFSFNSAVCTASLVQSSERVVAATPPAVERSIADISGYLQAQRDPSEFGDDQPSAPTPGSNPQAPPFPQDPGPNFPVRPEFDNPGSTSPTQPQSRPEPSRLTPGRSGASINEPCNPTLLTASAKPATEIIVKGIPSNFDPKKITIQFKDISTDTVIQTLAMKRDDGSLGVAVPLHPTKLGAGGDVQLTISSGNVACPAVSLRIEPLPNAPGSTRQVLTTLQTSFNRLLQITGVNRNQLQGNYQNLPPELKSLALSYWFLEHPKNPNSQKAILDGTAPILEGKSFDWQLVDSLLASSGFIDAINAYLNEGLKISKTWISVNKEVANKEHIMPNILLSYSKTSTIKLAKVNSNGSECRKISTDSELDIAMTQQDILNNHVNGDLFKGVSTSFNLALIALESAVKISGGGAVIGFATKLASTFMSNALLIATLKDKRDAALLPSKLTSLTFTAEPTHFEESPPSSGRYAPSTGSYKNVYLSAEGTDWKLSSGDILEILFSALSFLKRADTLPLIGKAIENELVKAANSIYTGLAENQPDIVKLQGPCRYQQISAVDSTEAIISNQSVIRRGLSTSYEPVGSGTAVLTLRVKPNRFAGQKPAQIHQEVIAVGKRNQDSPDQTAQQSQTLKRCRVGKFLPDGAFNPGECVIQGPVMTTGGFVDGVSACGICNLFIGGSPPDKGSCRTRPIDERRVPFSQLSVSVPCPSNWDSGW